MHCAPPFSASCDITYFCDCVPGPQFKFKLLLGKHIPFTKEPTQSIIGRVVVGSVVVVVVGKVVVVVGKVVVVVGKVVVVN